MDKNFVLNTLQRIKEDINKIEQDVKDRSSLNEIDEFDQPLQKQVSVDGFWYRLSCYPYAFGWLPVDNKYDPRVSRSDTVEASTKVLVPSLFEVFRYKDYVDSIIIGTKRKYGNADPF